MVSLKLSKTTSISTLFRNKIKIKMLSSYVSSVFKIFRVLFNVVVVDGDNSNELVGEGMIGERDRVKGFWLGRIGEIGVSRLKDGVGLT